MIKIFKNYTYLQIFTCKNKHNVSKIHFNKTPKKYTKID